MADFPFAIIGFDLDGTLVDTHADLGPALNHALALAGRPEIEPDSVSSLVGGGSRVMLERAFARTGGQPSGAGFEAAYAALLEHYSAHIADHSRPYPGCLATLDALAASGCTLAVVTNKPEYLSLKLLTELDLLHRFACVVGGDTLGPGRAKPAPDPILEAIALCGGGSFAMVGDSSYDVRAAKAAAVPVVALSFGYNDQPVGDLGADAVIDHYDALIPALRAL